MGREVCFEVALREWIDKAHPSPTELKSAERWLEDLAADVTSAIARAVSLPGGEGAERYETRIPGTRAMAEFCCLGSDDPVIVVSIENGSTFF